MVKQQSPRAGPAERSSGRHTLPEDIAPRIALPITLLASWFIIWALLSNIILLSLVSSSTPTQLKKDCFPRRNPRQDSYNLRLTKKTDNLNNTSVLALRSNQASQGHYSIIAPRRRNPLTKKKKLTKAEDGGTHDNGSYDNEGPHGDGSYDNGGPYDDGLYDDG